MLYNTAVTHTESHVVWHINFYDVPILPVVEQDLWWKSTIKLTNKTILNCSEGVSGFNIYFFIIIKISGIIKVTLTDEVE